MDCYTFTSNEVTCKSVKDLPVKRDHALNILPRVSAELARLSALPVPCF